MIDEKYYSKKNFSKEEMDEYWKQLANDMREKSKKKDEFLPGVPCRCGGKIRVEHYTNNSVPRFFLLCGNCGLKNSEVYDSTEEALKAAEKYSAGKGIK